jgi:hypothetical protein
MSEDAKTRAPAGGCTRTPVRPDTSTAEADSPRISVTPGGAWCDWKNDCRLDTRRIYRAAESSPRIGFRLARS